MMKAAMIGAGFIADFHAEGYSRLPDVRLAAVCDTDAAKAQALAGKWRCAAYSSAEEMLQKERPDVVSVCLPTFLHEEYTVLALRAGAHVLCEKPMALSMDACRRMAEAARHAGKLLMIGQVLRWWPEYQTIAREIERMGTPEFLSVQRLQHASRTAWLADPEKGGGVCFDLFVHDLDFLCSRFGYAPEIRAASGMMGPEGSWRSLCVMLAWPGGAAAKIEASNLMPAGFPFTAAFRADWQKACLSYTFRAPVNIQKDAKTQTEFLLFENGDVRPLPFPEGAQTEAFNREIAAFVRGAQSGVNPLPPEDTLAVMAVIHRVKNMLDAGRTA